MTLLAALASDATLDAAFVWLCGRRRDYPDHADIWAFRRHWPAEKARLRSGLSAGRFRFGLLDRITKADGAEIDLWSARDALVLKALATVLAGHLPVSRSCTHVKGHGGAKAAVRQVMAKLPGTPAIPHRRLGRRNRYRDLPELRRPVWRAPAVQPDVPHL